jgi:hypothetical protein
MKSKKVPPSPAVETEPARPEKESTETTAFSDLSRIPVEIDGKTYNLSFEFGDLAKAERLFKSQGHRLNLLVALPELTLESVREVFPCAAHRHHPDLTWEQAQALVTIPSSYPIATAIVQAWNEASAKNAAPVTVAAAE